MIIKAFSFFLLVLLNLSVQATDSSLLKKRIEKINSLVNELKALSLSEIKKDRDTTILKLFRKIEACHFAPPLNDPQFNITISLVSLRGIVKDSGMNIFKVSYPDPSRDSIVDVKKLSGYLNNTLIAYVNMFNDDWELFYFAFKEDSDQLIYLIEAGGEQELYRRKKEFLNKLHFNPIQ